MILRFCTYFRSTGFLGGALWKPEGVARFIPTSIMGPNQGSGSPMVSGNPENHRKIGFEMTERQKRYVKYKSYPQGWYHFVTDKTVWLFHSQEEFVFGMNTIALCTLLYPVRIVRFELMGNHIHLVLQGTGAACLKVFFYIRKRLGVKLDFRLIPIKDDEHLATVILYVDRNPYETDLNVLPGGYPWGTGGLGFRMQPPGGVRADTLSKAYLRRILRSDMEIPSDFRVDKGLGMILPVSYVDTAFFERLFGTASFYLTRFVKALETFLHTADEVGEQIQFSTAEVDSLIEDLLRTHYGGNRFRYLHAWEKEKLVQLLANQYRIPHTTLADRLDLPPYLVGQMIRSKRNR